MRQTLMATVVALASAGGTARAVPSPSYDLASLGLSLGAYTRGGRTLGGEVAFWHGSGGPLAYGVDGGLTDRTWSAEAELAGAVPVRRSAQLAMVLGLGAGVVRAHEATGIGLAASRRTGVQATVWALPIVEMPLPLFPYARVEAYREATVVGGGLMLKLPVPLRLAR